MYDEIFKSFEWLFETFRSAHNGKQPKTIYTVQDSAMGKVVKEVFLEAWYGLYTFHIMQNGVEHLAEPDDEESSTSPKHLAEGEKKELSICSDFSVCLLSTKMKKNLAMHVTS